MRLRRHGGGGLTLQPGIAVRSAVDEDTPEGRDAIERVLRQRQEIGSDRPLFPAPKSPGSPVAYELVRKWYLKAEELAGLPKLSGTTFHGYRRKWVTERKHHADVDVAEAGGWASVDSLRIYQRSDPETVRRVNTDRRPVGKTEDSETATEVDTEHA